MKKILFAFITSLVFTNVFAQRTEYRVALNSGLFSFHGNNAEAVTLIN